MITSKRMSVVYNTDWRETVNFLDGCKYSVGDDDKDLQDLLQTVINHEFTVDDNFCKFVNQCSSLGLDVSRALKAIFSVEYLTTADQLIADKVLKEDYMKKALCLLNQRVCISYPALNVPWFQERDDVLRTYSNQIDFWKSIPKDLVRAITKIAGGTQFVGKEVFLDYGIPAWRVLIIDQNNKLVKFSTRNLKLANEMKYRRLVIRYRKTHEIFDRQSQLLKQVGYSSVVIYRSELSSIGLAKLDDRLEFLRERIFKHEGDVHAPPMVNFERVSSQWRDFLKAKQ
ncbi:FAST kinase domain-containing protein 1, mitochondrial-like isoform X4 [Mercenaria mercenaria]|uniref:FAST kinase domain-containing protein 1, mitochondrial-like isoform X4 n=1 Tax=Mercenaria mercenaria TaxID=6596 RepID=UPI00234ED4CF|nr:FAST kinase domain-containing protein 1, mitochondrial-like isoform X4 [Mercenaria mercenaria]